MEPLSTPAQESSLQSQDHWRTIMLIFFLGILALGLVIASVYQVKPKQPPIKHVMVPSPTPPFAFTTLSLNATPSSILTQKYVNITISTDKNSVTAVQMEMGFDPKIVSNVAIMPGTFFTNPIQLIKHIDQTNGRISYALGIQPTQHGIQGNGVVATLTYMFSPAPTAGQTPLFYFLPKTLVTAEGQTQSVLKTTTDLLLPPTNSY